MYNLAPKNTFTFYQKQNMQIINTFDGSHTIYVSEMNEQYHSLNGALTESQYVYIEKGYNFHPAKKVTVFEVGFGTGLNSLLTALRAEQEKRPTTYIAIEKFPLHESVTGQLNYGSLISLQAQAIFEKIHRCKWDEFVEITGHFSIKKIKADLTGYTFEGPEKFNVVYYDAFGPDKQPEMWAPQIFCKISSATSTGGVLVTYSAKGEVRRQLSASGFAMERLAGPPGKNQMLRGIKRGANI
jgi:tRNA U34 5-methylaminomethyl-2-thiouridine-forming methyltransferase MnmC